MTITAEIIADSISETGVRITTFELEYWRGIHAELMTHRVFSRNAASSRAIPVKAMNDLIRADVAGPIHFGKNKSGMQDAGEHFEKVAGKYTAREWWEIAADKAVSFSDALADAGYAKQVCNRVTEPYQRMKVVVTATEFDNWFWLRNHEDADPTIHVLAATMLAAYKDNTPRLLLAGEWHTPYYGDGFWSDSGDSGLDAAGVSLADALMISASCCAQVSYRKLDDTLEKAREVYARLIESQPVHASPVEHQATPMAKPLWQPGDSDASNNYQWEDGTTHMDCRGNFWSGNFCHWIQHRQLIPGHTCTKYEELA